VAKEAKAKDMPMGCLTNGYTTIETTEILTSVFSFFNVSLKGLSDQFNKKYVGIETSEPVQRNIKRLARDRHVEVTTTIIQGANDSEIDAIAGFLAGIDPEIPWHVFRLLPEDEMEDAEYPEIEAINTALRSARKRLRYIYFHNFVGSDWVNTLCPACGADVIRRFSLGCGGDRLDRVLCKAHRCPQCGEKIKLLTKNQTQQLEPQQLEPQQLERILSR
jgi:pyruvate-formate lyase-activating enzyme